MDIKHKNCEVCKIEAKCLCFKCMSYFCDSFFKLSHSSEEYKVHKKDKIDLFVPMDLKCPEHKIYSIGLFCTNEKGKI
jgi:hypothetical protein